MSNIIDYPYVTINILGFNRKKELDYTINKLKTELNYPKDKLEIILIDNHSTDGTKEYVHQKYPDIKIIRLSKNYGISGWNVGFKYGRGDYFLVLDDDAYFSGNTLINTIKIAQKHNADIVSVRVVHPTKKYEFTKLVPVGIVSFWGCCIVLNRSVIEKIHGFDNDLFIYAHEIEFLLRAYNSHFKHIYSTKNFGFHLKEMKAVEKPKLDFATKVVLRNYAYIINKYFSGFQRFYANLNNISNFLLYCIKTPKFLSNWSYFFAGMILGIKKCTPIDKRIQNFYLMNYADFQNPLVIRLKYKTIDLFYRVKRRFYLPKTSIMLKF